jgi:hypothetical protein
MAHFRIGGLASLLIFGCASVAAAQSPVFQKTSQIVDDDGNGVPYLAETSYGISAGFLGLKTLCCPEGSFLCKFSIQPVGGGTPLGDPQANVAPGTSKIFAIAAVDLIGPAQLTVSLTGTCYLQLNGGKLFLPFPFITSYSLIVEKPNFN